MTNAEEPRLHPTVLDDDVRHVARVYAEALLDAAEKKGQAAEVLDDLEGFVREVLDRDPHIGVFLSSPGVGRERKREALAQALAGQDTGLAGNFLFVLNDHDRLDVLRAVAIVYRELFDRRAGRIMVQVESAVPLADDQRARLEQELRETFHKEPILEARVNPELLGGLVVRVDDWVYDASVRTRLEGLRNNLIERSSHEVQSERDRFRSGA